MGLLGHMFLFVSNIFLAVQRPSEAPTVASNAVMKEALEPQLLVMRGSCPVAVLPLIVLSATTCGINSLDMNPGFLN